MTYGAGNLGHSLGQAQKCGRVEPVNGTSKMPGFKLKVNNNGRKLLSNINISLYDLLIECNFHITEARPKFSGGEKARHYTDQRSVMYDICCLRMKQTSNQLHTDIL